MLLYILVIIFFICMFSVLLCMLACISLLGLANPAKNFISKFLSSSYDRQYVASAENQPINTQCFICLDRMKCQVMATCNHSFCASCICSYIDSKPGRAIQCPACRQSVCVLFRKFNPANAEERGLKDKICEYNFRYSQQPGFFRSIFEIGTLIREAPRLLTPEGIRYLLTNPRVKIIIVMIIYTLSPIDLIPEAIFGPIGLIDDSVVTMNIVRQFSSLLINFVRQQGGRNRERHVA